MESSPSAARKALLIKLAVVAVVLGAVGLVVLRGVDVHALVDRVLDAVRQAGPAAFFTAMAVLPAFGVPALAFMLPAGPVFGPTLGMPVVIALSLAALTLNMMLSYWLARFALRPWLGRLIARLGYKLPQVPPGDTTSLIVLLRVTPGVPYVAQNYLLGLADAPFGQYLLISCLSSWPHQALWVYFGQQLKDGHGGLILLGVLLMVALVVATRLVRKHLGRKHAKLIPGAAPRA